MSDLPAPPRRVQPHNLEAEASVIGAVLIKPKAFPEVEALVQTEDFFLPANREIWDAMVRVNERGMPLDFVSIADELKARGILDRLPGGTDYLIGMAAAVPTAENVNHYLRIVREKSSLRKLAMLSTQMHVRAMAGDEDPGKLLDEMAAAVLQITQRSSSQDVIHVRELLDEMMDTFEARFRDKKIITGVPTGITELDEMLGGLQPGNLILVAARPSMGKTGMAVSFASRCGIEFNVPALFFSLEMMKLEILERLFVQRAGINSQHLRTGQFDDDAWRRLTRSATALHKSWIYIDDEAVTLRSVRAKAMRWRARHPTGLAVIFIDYIQLMKEESRNRNESRNDVVSRISNGIKQLAKELKLPIVALAQLSREVEKRGDEPKLSDLRESGSLEQDADVIVFPWRDPKDENWPGNQVEMIIAKNRNGACGRFRVLWVKHLMLFGDLKQAVAEEDMPHSAPFDPAQDRRLPPEHDD